MSPIFLAQIVNHVSGPYSIFAFDGDGICTYVSASYCATATTKYEGPGVTFSGINSSGTTGTVNVSNLAAGATTYFSLEGSPASISAGGGINLHQFACSVSAVPRLCYSSESAGQRTAKVIRLVAGLAEPESSSELLGEQNPKPLGNTCGLHSLRTPTSKKVAVLPYPDSEKSSAIEASAIPLPPSCSAIYFRPGTTSVCRTGSAAGTSPTGNPSSALTILLPCAMAVAL